MPELPEVETIRRTLGDLAGVRITGVRVYRESVIKEKEFDIGELAGKTITAWRRRGKNLLMEAGPEHLLIAHMGMSGRFFRVMAGEPEEKHLHLAIELENGEEIRYVDARRFGSIRLVGHDRELFANLGPEPWDEMLESHLKAVFSRKSGPVKAALLDQSVVAGIGNIYADEILHAAGIAPDRKARSLSDEEIVRLVKETRRVLEAGIAMRGTTFRDYRDGKGRPGEFASRLSVYGRKGERCPRCGAVLLCTRIAGRSTHFCPLCQN